MPIEVRAILPQSLLNNVEQDDRKYRSPASFTREELVALALTVLVDDEPQVHV